ncbi:MAG TPA: cation diffusion facilitator family transporter [Myxococcales bacterium]|nr:cation diffusion facilitator family transporter [Myxococcales bacterium]
MQEATPTSRPLTRFAWLSIAAAVVTIALKLGAFFLTGSVGLLSDALESLVNLVAALLTLWMLALSARSPDEKHAFGYGKAEYVASGAEGALILIAAVGIAWAAIHRLIAPQPLSQAPLGLLVSAVASLVNLGVSRSLFRAGERHHSIALEADARHLLTDVWTSAGVIAGVGIVALTGFGPLDPIVALLVAVNIVYTGAQLVRRSFLGLIDVALPPEELAALDAVLKQHAGEALQFHAVWTRQAGSRRFISMHMLVPGKWTVRNAHDLAELIEEQIRAALPNASVLVHIEPLEDPASYDDQVLDRGS